MQGGRDARFGGRLALLSNRLENFSRSLEHLGNAPTCAYRIESLGFLEWKFSRPEEFELRNANHEILFILRRPISGASMAALQRSLPIKLVSDAGVNAEAGEGGA
jgi:hypothetical protein